jgi:hypothetical protein
MNTLQEKIEDLKKRARNEYLPESAIKKLNEMIVNLEKSQPDITIEEKLVGQNINEYYLGTPIPELRQIGSIKITDQKFDNRTVSLYTKTLNQLIATFPYDQLTDFLQGNQITVKDNNNEPYIIELVKDDLNKDVVSESDETITELRSAIETITEVLPDLKGADKKQAKEALKICKELLADMDTENQLKKGGKISDQVAIPGKFTIDGERTYDGFYFEEVEWNGFKVPYFTESVSDQIANELNGQKINNNELSKSGWAFNISEGAPETDSEIYYNQQINTTDGLKDVYGIGAFRWTWELAELKEGGLVSGENKFVAFPEDLTYKYFVIDEDSDNYTVVQVEKLDHWKNANKFEKVEFLQESIPKSEMVEVDELKQGGEISDREHTIALGAVLSNAGDTTPKGKKYVQNVLGSDLFFKRGIQWFYNTPELKKKTTKELLQLAEKLRKSPYLEHGGPVSDQMALGIKVEEEHRATLEKLAKGEITVDEAVKETAAAHIKEDPEYYTKLMAIEHGNK